MAQPIFVETGWKGSITLGDREWQVQRLESKPTFNFNRQVWFFMTASVITQPPPAPQSKISPAAPTVAIFGQVLRQGKYTFRPGMTLSDLIQQAQGISKQAGSQAEVQRGPRNSLIKLPNGGVFRFQKGDVITIKESPAKVSASTASGFPQQSDADVKARQRLILQDWLAKRQELMAEFDQPELSKIKPTPPGYTDLDAFWHQQVQRAQETLKSTGLEVIKPPRL